MCLGIKANTNIGEAHTYKTGKNEIPTFERTDHLFKTLISM